MTADKRKRNPVADEEALPAREGDLAEMLKADFRAHGARAVAAVRKKNPATYLRTVAELLPRELGAAAAELQDIDDDELAAAIRNVRVRLAASPDLRGRREPSEEEPSACDLSPVSAAGRVPRRRGKAPRAAVPGGKPARQESRRRQ
jgi:hypothetical protein